MRLRIVATLAVILVLALTGCAITKGSGKVVTESRVVSGFDSVALEGSGELIITQGDTESLTVEAEDNILPADSLRVSLSGSGSITLQKVTATDLVVDLSGSGSYKAPDMKSSTAKVGISGSGSVTVWAQESLATDISGSGSVAYYGRPAVTSTGSGSGSVKSLGDK